MMEIIPATHCYDIPEAPSDSNLQLKKWEFRVEDGEVSHY